MSCCDRIIGYSLREVPQTLYDFGGVKDPLITASTRVGSFLGGVAVGFVFAFGDPHMTERSGTVQNDSHGRSLGSLTSSAFASTVGSAKSVVWSVSALASTGILYLWASEQTAGHGLAAS